MTANENTGMILSGPVIPAKAGIQSWHESCKNSLESAIIVLFPIMSTILRLLTLVDRLSKLALHQETKIES